MFNFCFKDIFLEDGICKEIEFFVVYEVNGCDFYLLYLDGYNFLFCLDYFYKINFFKLEKLWCKNLLIVKLLEEEEGIKVFCYEMFYFVDDGFFLVLCFDDWKMVFLE